MTLRTPRRHRRLALIAAGTVAAMVLLPGAASAASAQVVHFAQRGTTPLRDPVVPGDPVGPVKAPPITLPGPLDDPTNPDFLRNLLNSTRDKLTGSHVQDPHRGGDVRRNDTPDSEEIRDPHPPDHASGAVGDVNLFRSRLLQITGYYAGVEDNGSAHSDVTVLGLGGNRIGGDQLIRRAAGIATELKPE